MKKTTVVSAFCVIILSLLGHGYYFISVKISEKQLEKNLVEAERIYKSIPPWHKKIHTDRKMRIGLITDTHVRPIRIERSDERDEAPRELKEDHRRPVEQFVSQMEMFSPDFIVHLGDVIEGTNDDYYVGSQGVTLINEELKKVGVPVYWAVGNHDLRSLTKAQFMELLGLESLDQVFDVGDHRFIILDANYDLDDHPRSPDGNSYIRGKLPETTLDWLEDQLKTDKRVVIFMHHGTFMTDLAGDPKDEYQDLYDEEGGVAEDQEISGVEYYKKQSIINAAALNALLREYRVDAIFNGHMEAPANLRSGVTTHYSLTGTKKSYTYPGSFYAFEITGGVSDMTLYYTPEGQNEIREIDFEKVEDL